MSQKICRGMAGGILVLISLIILNVSKAVSDLRLGAVFDMNQADGSINVQTAADISAYLMAINDANLKYKNITIKSAIRNSNSRFSDSAVAGSSLY